MMIADCLTGIRVLDLGGFIPGPLAAMWLSDLGAEVVKVESPDGDPMRTMGPCDPDGTTPFYKLANRNKSVVRLDLKTAAGRESFARLLGAADVLICAFRPGVLDRLGFDPATVERLNPRLITCALSGYGGTGPFARRAGHDLSYLAASGLLSVTGPAGRPLMVYPPLADHAGAMAVVNAVLAALLARGQSGRGGRLDVSLAEAALGWMGGVLTMARRGAADGRESGLIDGGAACYRVYATGDGRFATLAALEPRFWATFCTAVGRPDWIARHGEPMPQTALIAELDALFAGRPLAEWAALLEPLDCTFEPVVTPDEIPDHPQHRARGLVRESPDGIVEVALPILAGGAPPPPRRPLVEVAAETVIARWS